MLFLFQKEENKSEMEKNLTSKKIKIIIKYTRPKVNDSKTIVLPAPSTKVRRSLYNLRCLSGLMRDLPRLPPMPPTSRLSSTSSSTSGTSSTNTVRQICSQPPPSPPQRRVLSTTPVRMSTATTAQKSSPPIIYLRPILV